MFKKSIWFTINSRPKYHIGSHSWLPKKPKTKAIVSNLVKLGRPQPSWAKARTEDKNWESNKSPSFCLFKDIFKINYDIKHHKHCKMFYVRYIFCDAVRGGLIFSLQQKYFEIPIKQNICKMEQTAIFKWRSI